MTHSRPDRANWWERAAENPTPPELPWWECTSKPCFIEPPAVSPDEEPPVVFVDKDGYKWYDDSIVVALPDDDIYGEAHQRARAWYGDGNYQLYRPEAQNTLEWDRLTHLPGNAVTVIAPYIALITASAVERP